MVAKAGGMVLDDLIAAMTDKQTQMDLRFRGVELTLKGTRLGVQLTGTVTLTVNLRDLTDPEKKALATSTVSASRD